MSKKTEKSDVRFMQSEDLITRIKQSNKMENIRTHREISRDLCGTPVLVKEGFSQVRLETNSKMAVDEKGLVHGGFVFGLADHAAMIAVNDPNVVLSFSEVSFTSPVRAGDIIVAEAKVVKSQNRRRIVKVSVRRNETKVFGGEFTCVVLDKHVLAENKF